IGAQLADRRPDGQLVRAEQRIQVREPVQGRRRAAHQLDSFVSLLANHWRISLLCSPRRGGAWYWETGVPENVIGWRTCGVPSPWTLTIGSSPRLSASSKASAMLPTLPAGTPASCNLLTQE